ncbi:hypothetical protein ACFPYJ_11190 [Paenibacillus solisilvae]|uniref:Uncharacterized protein n=1 Tax=Paenibacillus solisilvae TaxID=2486751 RepID=A0ABW0VYU5_9BACL
MPSGVSERKMVFITKQVWIEPMPQRCSLYQEINQGKEAQAVFPGKVLAEWFDFEGIVSEAQLKEVRLEDNSRLRWFWARKRRGRHISSAQNMEEEHEEEQGVTAILVKPDSYESVHPCFI